MEAEEPPRKRVRVTQALAGNAMDFSIAATERVRDLQQKIAKEMGRDPRTYNFELICGDTKIQDVNRRIADLPSLDLGLILRKKGVVKTIDTSIGPSERNFVAGGVVGQDGCIYFAPNNHRQVLRISAEGAVELLDTELPEGMSHYWAKGVALGSSIYFAPCNAAKVLCINTEGRAEMRGP